MCKTNALEIQEKLKKQTHISIPWLQTEFDLSYKDARLYVHQMIKCGWVSGAVCGIQYQVYGENLRLRKLRREEVEPLIEDLTGDCTAALGCIQKRQGMGATFEEISGAVYGDADAKEALELLHKYDLVYAFDGRCFSCVSQKTIRVLSEAVKQKRHRQVGRRLVGRSEEPDDDAIRKLFDELFDDD